MQSHYMSKQLSPIESKLKQAGFEIYYRCKGELKLQKCPLHRDKTPSLSINTIDRTYNCFSCGDKGNLNKLLSYFGLEYYHTPKISELESLLMDQVDQSEEINYKADINELSNYRYFHPYLVGRGFTREFILANKIGFDKSRARVTIPIFFDEKYYGCAARTVVDEIPKITYNAGMPKDKILYVPIVQNQSAQFLVVEGPIDALKSNFLGQDSASILGCNPSQAQINHVKRLANGRPVVLALDNDEAGKKGIEKWLKMTSDIETKIFNYTNGLKDIGEMNQSQFDYGIKNSISFWEYAS